MAQSEAPHGPEQQKPARKRKSLGTIGCLLGITAGLMGLVVSRLGLLWPNLDIFSQVTLQFFCVMFAFLCGLFMPRWKVLSASVLLVAMLCGISGWSFYTSANPRILGTIADGEKALKVASFNSYYLNNDLAAQQAEIARLNADIITIVEFMPNKRSIADNLKQLYPYQAHCQSLSHCNFAILSKYPIAAQDERMLWQGPPFMRIKLGPEWGGLTVYAVHTIRFPHSRAQMHQMIALANEIAAVSSPTLVMGDFNASPYSRLPQILEQGANLTRLTNLPSWPANFGMPQLAIDHIFASTDIRPLQSEAIGNAAGSDHYPISMTVAVPTN